jgi:hypothetical protein
MLVHLGRKSNKNTSPISFNTTTPTVPNLLRVLILEDAAVNLLITIRVRTEEKRLGENNLEFVGQNEVDYKSNIFLSEMKLNSAHRRADKWAGCSHE